MQSLYFKPKQYIYLNYIFWLKNGVISHLAKKTEWSLAFLIIFFVSKIIKQVILFAQIKSQKSFVERPCVCLRKILPHGNDHGF